MMDTLSVFKVLSVVLHLSCPSDRTVSISTLDITPSTYLMLHRDAADIRTDNFDLLLTLRTPSYESCPPFTTFKRSYQLLNTPCELSIYVPTIFLYQSL